MKQHFLLLVAALTAGSAISQNFSYEYEGVSLEYIINDTQGKTVVVAGLYNHDESSLNTMRLAIPEKVNFNDEWYEVVEIKENAFENLESLTWLEMPGSVKTIGYNAFRSCSLTDLIVPNSVETIEEGAFKGNPIMELVLEEGVTEIALDKQSFDYNKIQSIYLGRPHAADLCRQMTGLTSLVLGNSLTEVYDSEFAGLTELSRVTFGSALLNIGESAFEGCSLDDRLILSPTLENIGNKAFANSGVQRIAMGPDLKNIGAEAFCGCNLYNVSITAPAPPQVGDKAFEDSIRNLYVQGTQAEEKYKASQEWNQALYIMPLTVATTMEYSGDSVLTGDAGDRFGLWVKTRPMTSLSSIIFWQSTDPAIATVDSDGLVTLQSGIGNPDAECYIIARTIYASGPEVKVKVSGDRTASVETIFSNSSDKIIDYSTPYEIYGLDGRPAGKSVEGLAKGIYVIRQGATAVKMAVRGK